MAAAAIGQDAGHADIGRVRIKKLRSLPLSPRISQRHSCRGPEQQSYPTRLPALARRGVTERLLDGRKLIMRYYRRHLLTGGVLGPAEGSSPCCAALLQGGPAPDAVRHGLESVGQAVRADDAKAADRLRRFDLPRAAGPVAAAMGKNNSGSASGRRRATSSSRSARVTGSAGVEAEGEPVAVVTDATVRSGNCSLITKGRDRLPQGARLQACRRS
jgi:hypothetical protein